MTRRRRSGLRVLVLLSLVALTSAAPARAAAGPTSMPTKPGEPFVHEPSGFTFPARVGEFHRGPADRYDDAGLNISVGYRQPTDRVVATVYVYPADGESLDEHFAHVKGDVRQVHPGAKLIAESASPLRQGDAEHACRRATFAITREFDGGERDVHSQAYVLRVGERFVKFRFTYPAMNDKTGAEAVTAFVEALTLPKPKP